MTVSDRSWNVGYTYSNRSRSRSAETSNRFGCHTCYCQATGNNSNVENSSIDFSEKRNIQDSWSLLLPQPHPPSRHYDRSDVQAQVAILFEDALPLDWFDQPWSPTQEVASRVTVINGQFVVWQGRMGKYNIYGNSPTLAMAYELLPGIDAHPKNQRIAAV